jgi:protein required for attachment to host cells
MTHVRIRHGDWVFVGDGRKALLLRNECDSDLLDLRRVEVREDENRPDHDQSAVEPMERHGIDEERFAADIAARLNRAAEENRFEHIVIAAPPKVLGELRRDYSKKLQGKIVAEIDKDLTHHTFPDIAKVLGTRGV